MRDVEVQWVEFRSDLFGFAWLRDRIVEHIRSGVCEAGRCTAEPGDVLTAQAIGCVIRSEVDAPLDADLDWDHDEDLFEAVDAALRLPMIDPGQLTIDET